MKDFHGIIFIWIRTYREIFKPALVPLTYVFKNGRETWYFCARMIWFILQKEIKVCIISQDPTEIRYKTFKKLKKQIWD